MGHERMSNLSLIHRHVQVDLDIILMTLLAEEIGALTFHILSQVKNIVHQLDPEQNVGAGYPCRSPFFFFFFFSKSKDKYIMYIIYSSVVLTNNMWKIVQQALL